MSESTEKTIEEKVTEELKITEEIKVTETPSEDTTVKNDGYNSPQYEEFENGLDFDNIDVFGFGLKSSNKKMPKFQGEPFTIKNIEVRDEKTEEVIEKNVQVTVCHPQLAKIFRNAGLKGEGLF